MASDFGKSIRYTVFGQSHGRAIGVTIDGLPVGEHIDMQRLRDFLARRAPGQSELTTARKEGDEPIFLSGTVDDVTSGSPLTAIIENSDTRSADYEALKLVPRPGHADYPAYIRYGGKADMRGSGHFSGRLTAPLCIAGGIAKQILARRGIHIGAHIASIGDVCDVPFDSVNTSRVQLEAVLTHELPVNDPYAVQKMRTAILDAKAANDSIGGTIECMAIGMKAGIGDPMFSGLESRISAAIFAIPAIKGIEFGAGFGVASMRGSENNDEYYFDDRAIKTRTNAHGGALGGITSGMPVVFKVAVKPTPSISMEQNSIDLTKMHDTVLTVKGRHDPCIVPRAVPVVEAVTAMVLLDMIVESEGYNR